MLFDSLDDDDRVIHDETNGQNETKQRQSVDGKTKKRENRERANQRNRHCQQRNQSGPPVLQEDEYHEDYENQRLDESSDDLFDTLRYCKGGIQRDGVIEVFGKSGFQFFHQRLDAFHCVKSISAGKLIHGDDRRGLSVQASDLRVTLCP